MKPRRLAPCLLLAFVCSGCAVGPAWERPVSPAPSAWRGEPAAASAATLADLPWWEMFGDPALKSLIESALDANRDLRVALERVVEARARVGIAQADFFPQVRAGTDGSLLQTSREAFPNNPKPGDNDSPLYSVWTDVVWEIDVFGRIRRSTEAEQARYLATEEGARAVTLALVASVARSYFELRDLDLRLAIARRTLASRERSRELVRLRFVGGLTSEKDPNQAEAEYRRVQVSVLDLERQVAQKENQLAVLSGHAPSAIHRGLELPDMPVPVAVPVGLPSALIDRRPDLLAAEARLHATTADIGAAKALLFPRIALTAEYGVASTEMDALFSGGAQAWSLASGLLQPVFQGGRNRRRVQVTESRMRQALSEYEGTVLDALREVEDALVAYRKTDEQKSAQAARVAAERNVVRLSEVRYEGGVADYLEVLDAQRSLFSAELEEVSTLGARLVSLVQLYKALGGGWPAAPASAPPAPDAASTPAQAAPGA